MLTSHVKKSSFSPKELPVPDKDGAFRVVIECSNCKQLGYQRATWADGDLRVLGDSSGPSEYTRISPECSCGKRNAPEKFYEFEWTVDDQENSDDVERKKVGFKALIAIGILLQIWFSYINAGYRSPMNGMIAGFMMSGLAALGVWWYRLGNKEALSYGGGYAAYALAAWLPILIYFIFPPLIPWYDG